jgi:tRNA(Arg) A34 adenosine deaminase TadA
MCLGAIYWAHLKKVYYAGTKQDAADAGFDDSFIYEELARPYAQRHLPMENLLNQEAQEAFKEWKEKSDKIEY